MTNKVTALMDIFIGSQVSYFGAIWELWACDVGAMLGRMKMLKAVDFKGIV